MRIASFFLTAAATIIAGSSLAAQPRRPAPAQGEKADKAPAMDMVAMHCGTGMGMMRGAGGPPRDMPMARRDSMMKEHGQQGMGMMGGMMPGMMDMMGPPGPAMILEHKPQLGLSAAQVTRLETLQKQAAPGCVEHMRAGMNAMHAANQMLDAASPDWTAYSAKMKEATTHMAEGHIVMAKAAVAARDVLTPAQRKKLADTMSAMHAPK